MSSSTALSIAESKKAPTFQSRRSLFFTVIKQHCQSYALVSGYLTLRSANLPLPYHSGGNKLQTFQAVRLTFFKFNVSAWDRTSRTNSIISVFHPYALPKNNWSGAAVAAPLRLKLTISYIGGHSSQSGCSFLHHSAIALKSRCPQLSHDEAIRRSQEMPVSTVVPG